jgi:flagellar protein FliO/FliZ
MGANSLAPLLWFAAIIVAIPVVLWLLKRTPLGAAASQGGLRSVAVLPLAPNQRIVTVEVGQGEARRWLVLGVTPQSITALHEMAPQDAPPSAGEVPASSFAQTLARLRPGSRTDAR